MDRNGNCELFLISRTISGILFLSLSLLLWETKALTIKCEYTNKKLTSNQIEYNCCFIKNIHVYREDIEIKIDSRAHTNPGNLSEGVIIEDSKLPNIPADILNFDNLRYLSIKNTRITVLQPDSFENATELRYLVWIGFDWSHLGEFTFQHLISLQHLELADGSIKTIDKNAFEGLDKLLTLNLNENNIESLEVGTFKPLKNLEDLSIDSNGIEVLPAGLFTHNDKLKLISMTKNNISTIDSQLFYNLHNLTSLNLLDNICINKTLNSSFQEELIVCSKENFIIRSEQKLIIYFLVFSTVVIVLYLSKVFINYLF